jgi:protein-L-isoaspartate(D-aspartate) O-methyltransferase
VRDENMAATAEAARLNMVESQLRPNRVLDNAILEAFLAVPRERFVPEHLRNVAYIDEDLPLGNGRWLMEPMVLGRLLQVAGITPSESVLEVGSGTGYGAAVMAHLARSVVGIEPDEVLVRQAGAALAGLGLKNAVVRQGALERGYPDRAPYDVIVFGGAVGEIPAAILDQLAEGGRLLAVVKKGQGLGQATLVTRRRGAVARRVVFDAGTPLLPGLAPQPSFVF